MSKRKLLKKALGSPANLRFEQVIQLAEGFGFKLARVSGSHHIFTHPKIAELVNLQDCDGKAKPYQVRQLLRIAEKNNLNIED